MLAISEKWVSLAWPYSPECVPTGLRRIMIPKVSRETSKRWSAVPKSPEYGLPPNVAASHLLSSISAGKNSSYQESMI